MLILALIAAGMIAIMLPARNRVRLEYQSKQTLLEIQKSLQKFHVEAEAYPTKSPMTGADLIQYLMNAGHMKEPPLNPYTLKTYNLKEQEPDRIVYQTDELAETYSLSILEPESEKPLFLIDSTKHHSLE